MDSNNSHGDSGNHTIPKNSKDQNLIVFSKDDIQEGLKECEFFVVGKIISEKNFHVNSLQNALSNIWNHPAGFKIVDLGEEIFSFFFHKTKDMEKALKGQSWIFRNSWLLLQRWQCAQNPRDMVFNSTNIWLQIWGLPIHCQTKQMGRRTRESMGTVFETDIYEIQGKGSYVRALVEIDISKPLLPGINAGSKNDEVFGLTSNMRNCHNSAMYVKKGKPTPNHQDEEKKRKLAHELLDKLSGLSVNPGEHQNAQENLDSHTAAPTSENDIAEDPHIINQLSAAQNPNNKPVTTLIPLTDLSNTIPEEKTATRRWKRTRDAKTDQGIGGLNNVRAVGCTTEGRSRAGGLALFCFEDLTVDIISTCISHIDAKVSMDDGESFWYCSGVYGFLDNPSMPLTWDLIRSLDRDIEVAPWLCFGDFNQICAHEEKRGGNPVPHSLLSGFRDCLQCLLVDLGFIGDVYTWDNIQ
ncbi:Endonuclease/exonuclease/phosphatase superfamily [Sesbania bispinosa]|nr:Endonuclease/exonuclease/phosphatase superfamily [Sesbania bispinosa]